VLRGGSFNNNPDNTRAAYRNDIHPNNSNNNVGSRVSCASQISSRTATAQARRPTGCRTCCGRLGPAGIKAPPALAADHGLRPEAQCLSLGNGDYGGCPV